MSTQGAPGVWMSVAGSTVELLVPRLFAAVPIVLPTDGIAVSDPDEVEHEELPPGAQPIDIVVLHKGRREANLLVVVAQRMLFPPVRYRAASSRRASCSGARERGRTTATSGIASTGTA